MNVAGGRVAFRPLNIEVTASGRVCANELLELRDFEIRIFLKKRALGDSRLAVPSAA